MDCLVSHLFSARLRGPPESTRRGANFFCCGAAVIKLTDDVDLVTLYAPYASQRDTRANRVRLGSHLYGINNFTAGWTESPFRCDLPHRLQRFAYYNTAHVTTSQLQFPNGSRSSKFYQGWKSSPHKYKYTLNINTIIMTMQSFCQRIVKITYSKDINEVLLKAFEIEINTKYMYLKSGPLFIIVPISSSDMSSIFNR